MIDTLYWIYLAIEVIICVLFWKFFMPDEYSKQERKQMRKEKWEHMTAGEFIARIILPIVIVLFVLVAFGFIG